MKFLKQITDFLTWDPLIYPPYKIQDVYSINGVRLHQPIIKEVLWSKYLNNRHPDEFELVEHV